MGFINKIGYLLRDSANSEIKAYLKNIEGWDGFMFYVCTQENIENGVLGGRVRYRHLTADDINQMSNSGSPKNKSKSEDFLDHEFWGIPIPII